jgi:hypothetical protein
MEHSNCEKILELGIFTLQSGKAQIFIQSLMFLPASYFNILFLYLWPANAEQLQHNVKDSVVHI